MSEPTQAPPPFVPPTVEQHPQPLARLPLPPFVLILAVVTIIAFLIGLARFPGALSKGIAYERGHRKLEQGDAAEAAALLAPIAKEYPNALDVRIDLLEAYMRSDQFQEAGETLMTFDGVKVTREQETRLSVVESQLDELLKKIEQEEGKKP